MHAKLGDSTVECRGTDHSDRTFCYKPLPVRPCPLHHTAFRVRNRIKPASTRFRRHVQTSEFSGVPCRAQVSQESAEDTGSRAVELVSSLRQELEGLKCMLLSSACSLSVYRLTVLCTTQHRAAVLAALAQVFDASASVQHDSDTVLQVQQRTAQE